MGKEYIAKHREAQKRLSEIEEVGGRLSRGRSVAGFAQSWALSDDVDAVVFDSLRQELLCGDWWGTTALDLGSWKGRELSLLLLRLSALNLVAPGWLFYSVLEMDGAKPGQADPIVLRVEYKVRWKRNIEAGSEVPCV